MMGIKALHLVDSGGLSGVGNMLPDLVAGLQRQGLRPLILRMGDAGYRGKADRDSGPRVRLAGKSFRMRAGSGFSKGMEVRRCAQREGSRILRGQLPRVTRQIPLITMLHGYAHASPFSILWSNHRPDE